MITLICVANGSVPVAGIQVSDVETVDTLKTAEASLDG